MKTIFLVLIAAFSISQASATTSNKCQGQTYEYVGAPTKTCTKKGWVDNARLFSAGHKHNYIGGSHCACGAIRASF